jgi:hypothetical protein
MKKFLLVDTSTPFIDRSMILPGMTVHAVSNAGGEITITYNEESKQWHAVGKTTGVTCFRFDNFSDLFTEPVAMAFIKGYKMYLVDFENDVDSVAIMSIGRTVKMNGVFSPIPLSENIAALMRNNEDMTFAVVAAERIYNKVSAERANGY